MNLSVKLARMYAASRDDARSYRLTTVRFAVEDIARAAVGILLNAIATRSNEVVMRMFPGEIIERGSVINRNA